MRSIVLIFSILVSFVWAKEKFFVVERESGSLAIIEDGLTKSHIENLHNLNHAVVKFKDKDGYLISRDGYVIKFNPESEKVEAEYKTSKSAIGFVVGDDFVAVANYDNKSVDILSRDLKPIQRIITDSKNVGIKLYKDYLIFAQMDKDLVSVYKRDVNSSTFSKVKDFKVGKMPFDAMIENGKYIVGFFLSKSFGVIDLDKLDYKEIKVTADGNKPVLKVPHFGFWSISGDKIFIPSVGDNKVMVYDKNFKFIKNIPVQGLPVFTSLSPDKKYLAVTFSGKDFPTVQIVDTNTLKVIKTFKFNGKVLHLRWSNNDDSLYISVNDANQISVIDTKDWILEREIFQVERPSGIFIYERK